MTDSTLDDNVVNRIAKRLYAIWANDHFIYKLVEVNTYRNPFILDLFQNLHIKPIINTKSCQHLLNLSKSGGLIIAAKVFRFREKFPFGCVGWSLCKAFLTSRYLVLLSLMLASSRWKIPCLNIGNDEYCGNNPRTANRQNGAKKSREKSNSR